MLALAQRQVVILIRSSSKAGVRSLIRALEDEGVALRVSLDPVELLGAPGGATVLLEVRAAHAAWLNVNRTIITERGLRVIAWASEADADAIANAAPDFWDWISHLVDVPGGPHGFARLGLTRATSTIAWYGDDLDGLRRATGREGPSQTIAASTRYDALVEAARSQDWLLIEGLARPEQLDRLRWALAEARREAPTVLVHPKLATLPGWYVVHDRALDWSMARELLAAIEIDDPARIAALLDFELEALARAQSLALAPADEREAVLATDDPGVPLIADNAGRLELVDALSWRVGGTRSLPRDAIEATLREPPSLGRWLQLSERALRRHQWAAAQRWATAALELAQTPMQRETAEGQRRYALAQRPAPHVVISHAAESDHEFTAVAKLVERLRADGVRVEVDSFTEGVARAKKLWFARQVFETGVLIGVCSRRWLASFVHNEVPLWTIADQFELVVLDGAVVPALPELLRDRPVYALPEGYERLYARLTAQRLDADHGGPLARLRPLSGRTRPSLAKDDTSAAKIRPHNLPPRPAYFVNRAREIDLIASSLDEHGQVAVIGLAGAGKTALVTEYAYRHLHEYARVAWVELGDRSFDDANTELASLLLMLEGVASGSAVREALAETRTLLVLDDVRGELDPRWTELDAHVLLTSRRRDLELSARAIELAGLSLDDSLLLLLGHDPDEDHQRTATEVVQRLDGLPLALTLARARLERGRSPAELLGELHDDLRIVLELGTHLGDLLAELDSDDPDDMLARELALIVACLADAPLPAPVLSAALAQLRTELPSEAALDRARSRLFNIGLIAGADELRLHDLIARVLRTQAAPAHARAAVHGVASVMREIEDLARAVKLLERLRPHARQIVARMNTPATLDELVVAYQLAEERRFFGAPAEALGITERALARVDDDEHRAGLLVARGAFQRELGRLDEAAASYTEAIELFERIHGPRDRAEIAVAQHGLALVDWDRGQLDQARELLERSIALERSLRGTEAHAKVVVKLRDLARITRDQGDLARARELLERTLALAVEAAGSWVDVEVVGTLKALASVEWTLGALDSARHRLERALELWRELAGAGPHPNVATLLQELGHVLLAQGELDSASEVLERALAMGHELYGTRESLRLVGLMQSLGQVYSSRGELTRSRELFERAVALATRLGADSTPEFARTLHGLGVLLAAEGEHREAVETLRRALAIIEARAGTRDHLEYASTELALAVIMLQTGDRAGETMLVHGLQTLERDAPNHPILTQLRARLGGLVVPDPGASSD